MKASTIFEKEKMAVIEEKMPAIKVEALWRTLEKLKPFLPVHVASWLGSEFPLCLYFYVGYSLKNNCHYFWTGQEKIRVSAKLFDDEPSKTLPWDDVHSVLPEILALLDTVDKKRKITEIKCPPMYFIFRYKIGIRTQEKKGANKKGTFITRAENFEEAKGKLKEHLRTGIALFFEDVTFYQDGSFQKIEIPLYE